MEHIVKFEGGFDCIEFECMRGSKTCVPGTGGTHGRHGMEIRFAVKGEDGAIQFLLYTGWIPQRCEPSGIGCRECEWSSGPIMPADLGYHSRNPRYADQTPISDKCEFCDGQPCYYDGSSLNANDAMYALVNGGEKALWEFLDGYYAATFNGAAYPQPAEYAMPMRNHAGE